MTAARRAGALNPADDWPHRLASTALLSIGRSREAVAAADQARRLAPDFWRSHVCLAQAAVAAGDRRLAADAVGQALAIGPDEPDVQFTAGKVALAAGDLTRARAHQEAALAIDPGHSGAINELGRISLRERDASAAAGYFLRAARSAPGVPIFGRNTEVALAKVLTNITVAAAAVLAVAAGAPVATRIDPVPYAIVVGVLTGLAGAYAVVVVRRLPPDGRRHLARMLARRRWQLTIAGIVMIVVGTAGLAAIAWSLTRTGTSALPPALIVIATVAAGRVLVTTLIRRSRRSIR
jgi:tetratricopeptide (TPR) repeat protein